MNFTFKTLNSFLFSLLIIFPILYFTGCNSAGDSSNDVPTDEADSELTEATEPATTLNTMLQRLLIKKIDIEYGMDVGRGGALGTLDNILYVNTNKNTVDRHELYVYDMENHFRYEIDDFIVPTNYENMLESTIVEMDRYENHRYRVTGLFVEGNDDGTHTLFASHMYYEEEENCVSFNVSRTTVGFEGQTAFQTSDWDKIFTAQPFLCPIDVLPYDYRNPYPGQMHGGRMISYDDETLLVSVGGFSTDPRMFRDVFMDPEKDLGKFVLVNKTTGEREAYAVGSRNPQGLVRDKNGTIWATEHGPAGGDELNIVERGKNFGFPEVTLAYQYGYVAWENNPEQGRHEGYDKPAFAWMNSIAPSQLLQIPDEGKFDLWSGDLIVSTLGGQTMHRLRIIDDNRILYDERIPLDFRTRDIVMLPDGKMVLLTDNGVLVFIDDGGPRYAEMDEELEQRRANLDLYDQLLDVDDLAEGTLTAASIYSMNCSACHGLQEVSGIGPHLNNIIGREVGSLDDFGYSSVLEASDETWTPELLREYIFNPNDVFPNTTMAPVSLSEAEADSIIYFLENQ